MSDLLIRQIRPEEYADLADQVARVFSNDDPRLYERLLHEWLAQRPGKPDFSYEHFRVAIKDGQIVSHALVEPYLLRYGQARLHVSGIGRVCTHPDHRRQGYAAAVIHDALAYMAEQGAHLALLNGTHPYYHRFGFYPVWPHYRLSVRSHDAARLEAPLLLREARPADVPEMIALFERHWEGRIALIRTPEMWRWRLLTQTEPLRVVEAGSGEVQGYFWGQGRRAEVIADTPEALMTLFSEAGQHCLERGESWVEWLIPPDDLIAAYARRLLPVTLSAEYFPNGGWMARLIDTGDLIAALLPELTTQARLTNPQFNIQSLEFDCEPDTVRIGLKNERQSACKLNHRDFIQVMFGSLRPAALAGSLHLTAQAVSLLESLFPPRIASIAPWDVF